MTGETNKLGVILSAGGARAAYQVGVLKYIGQHFPNFRPKIYAGVSSGSINAAFLAQGERTDIAVDRMYHLWSHLKFDEVLKTNFPTILAVGRRILTDLFLSKVTRRLAFKSLLDATPLSYTLVSHIHFWKVSKAIRSGRVHGLAVSAMDYRNGTHCVFYDSHEPISPWTRKNRRSLRTPIRIRHIMASCSIPVLFEPIPIGDSFFGDGALGFNFPFSPAVHLGSSHILAIGLTSPRGEAVQLDTKKPLSLGVVAGAILNSMFVDNLESDYETLCRMNELANFTDRIKRVECCVISPSLDLGALAQNFINDIPFHLRQLLRTAALSASELGAFISYLMFTPGYLNALLELGVKDAKDKHDQIQKFLAPL